MPSMDQVLAPLHVPAGSTARRVGIVVAELDPSSGGLGQWCWQFITALARHVSSIHVVTQRFGDGRLPANVARHRISVGKNRTTFAQAAAEHVKQLQLDLVHDMGAGWRCDVFQSHGGSHLAWLTRRLDMYPRWLRPIKRAGSLLPRQRDFLRHCRRQFASADCTDKTFIALSQTVAEDFVRFHDLRPEQIALIYNGVDCRRYTPENQAEYRLAIRQKLGISEESLLLLLAAHNFRLKGVPELLTVAGRLAASRRPVHVVVAGGKRRSRWCRAACRAGLSGRATFIGTVADMAPYYAAADAYVHPTYYDPCSLVLLEAAASGLPIVTTRRANGAAELFRDGSEILTIADPRDSQALYERVEALFDDRLRRELGTAARRVALRHTFDRNVADILRLYDRCDRHRLAA